MTRTRGSRPEPVPPEGPGEKDPETLGRNAFALILAKLGRRDHTELELRRSLAAKGVPEPAAESALERARREGLVNDLRLATAAARLTARSGKRGPRRLVATLRQKGISAETAEAAAKEAFTASEEGEANLVRFAGRLLEKARGETRREKRARVVRSLLGRGFELSEAMRALRLAENALMAENSADDSDSDE
ncbi:MAG: regulatory protein RecX [Vicinamibacteria bacterium]|nr:regulatory protein RecX [Vicinamibacteria bacterium]